MKRKAFVIDGNNFNDEEGFYDEIYGLMAKDFYKKPKVGHNLNSLNDVLRGGFSAHKYGEPILLKWINFEKSKKDLGQELVDTIIKIILDNSGHDCELITYDLEEAK